MTKILLVVTALCVAVVGAGIAIRLIAKRQGAREAAALLAKVELESKPQAPPAAPPLAPPATPEPLVPKTFSSSQDNAPQAAKPGDAGAVRVRPTAALDLSAGQPDLTPSQKARVALSLVGADPDAEKYWVAAINNPDFPAKERKNLIEDLNEDGLSDPHHPAPEDLPLIENRLKLIADLEANPMDQANADAFAEAKKDLLNMYVSLAGNAGR